jgi:hypothetical protein
MLDRLLGNARVALGLAGFLRRTIDAEAGRAEIRRRLATREDSFLDLARRGIYENPKSPYRRLLRHAEIDLPALTRMVRELGLEATLERLYDAGVYVSFEELRGRKPIRRGDLEFQARVSDFDNPLQRTLMSAQTSGSRSQGTRVYLDLDMLAEESAHIASLFGAHRVSGRPIALWRPQPPAAAGMIAMLRYVQIGMRPQAWYSQDRFHLDAGGWRGALYLGYMTLVSYLVRRPFPWPRFTPQSRAAVLAEWLAAKKHSGTPAVLDTSVSGATRVCLVAAERGLDLSGSAFLVGGEPVTPARAAIMAAAGTTYIDRYSMMEAGVISIGCAAPTAADDMHVVTDKLIALSRDKLVGARGETVPALAYTTLLPTCSMVMLNAESGDYGDLEERQCGCPLGELGYTSHLSGVRGYDKLTSEGITFMGSELFRLVEETLPARFGGHATDYQLVEEEENGIPKVSIVASPALGEIDEGAIVEVVLQGLRGYYTVGALMTEQWRQSETLRVLRREPYTSGHRKILPLHILQKAGARRTEAPTRAGS